jgi:hypothetical protein
MLLAEARKPEFSQGIKKGRGAQERVFLHPEETLIEIVFIAIWSSIRELELFTDPSAFHSGEIRNRHPGGGVSVTLKLATR